MKVTVVFVASILLRAGLIYFGYTDIDYLVFTDAARFISQHRSPYDRATYRYTPLLAWLLYPTTWGGLWFDFGKVLFCIADILTGWLIIEILRKRMSYEKATNYACIWLLNPIVASISARGSSEGVVALLTIAILWATLARRLALAGCLLGFAVHMKIYPFIYAASIFWWLDNLAPTRAKGSSTRQDRWKVWERALSVATPSRIRLTLYSAFTFTILNLLMARYYGLPFFKHTFLYHFTRLDHRHNFSVYNTVLYYKSAYPQGATLYGVESLAFLPQLLLSVVIIPFLLARKHLAGTMLAQTFAFVTFNKVCTSQYFLWYLVFLPVYLPDSTLLLGERGVSMLVAWVLGQGLWLYQGYKLEFLGHSSFAPGLWLASIAFFLANCWILQTIVLDIGQADGRARHVKKTS